MYLPLPLLVVSTSLYILLLIEALALPLYTKFKLLESITRSSNIFTGITIIFFALRISWFWFLVVTDGQTADDFILNRVALLAFFSAFTLVLFSWIESLSYASSASESRRFLPNMRWKYFVINAVVYAFFISTMITFFVTHGNPAQGEKNMAYQVSIVAMAVLNLCIGMAFVIYGVFFGSKMRSFKITNNFRVVQVRLVSLCFTLCFLSRVVMMLYRPLTGQLVLDVIYFPFSYLIPEIIPIALQLYIQLKQNQYFISQQKLSPWERNSLIISE